MALTAAFPMPGGSEALVLHVGRLEVLARTDDGKEAMLTGDGRVMFLLRPRPQIWWEVGTDDPEAFGFGFRGDADYMLNTPTGLAAAALIPRRSDEETKLRRGEGAWVELDGTLSDQPVIGDPTGLHQIRVELLNFDAPIGTSVVRNPDGTNGAYLGRHVWTDDEWRLIVDARPNLDGLLREAGGHAGHAFTHTVSITRLDEQPFSLVDAQPTIDALFYFTSFISARLVGIALATGLDDLGRAKCVQWSTTITEAFGTRLSWYPEFSPALLEPLWPRFKERISDPAWHEALVPALRLYIEAQSRLIESGLAMSATAIETLTWSVLVNAESYLTEDAYERISFADRLRLLLRWAEIPVGYDPAGEPSLERLGREYNLDALEMLAWVRNRVVHPDKKKVLNSALKLEAWQLALWFVELVILRICGYEGDYGSRRKRPRHAGDTAPVPWIERA